MNGLLAVWKEAGYTSHDVVAKLRGILRQKKIGHTGTLDPQAEGVLLVCLGTATRACNLLQDKTKEYRTTIKLGTVTDTQDIWGTVIKETQPAVTEEDVEKAALSFLGDYAQIPPMYSAKKINGKKLYDLARQGVEVERKPSQVHIFSIQITKMELPYVDMTVSCSEGTYIRTLCSDIGEKLGCGACMSFLERTRVGAFSKECALSLSEIEKKRDDGDLAARLIPVDHIFSDLTSIIVKKEFFRLLVNGNQFQDEMTVSHEPLKKDEYVRVYLEETGFIGIYSFEEIRFQPVKIFYRSE